MSESEQSINTTLEDQQSFNTSTFEAKKSKRVDRDESLSEISLNTSTFELVAKAYSADRVRKEYMHETLPDGTTLTDLANVDNDQ